MHRRSVTLALMLLSVLGPWAASVPAADMNPAASRTGDSLAKARQLIAAQDWPAALAELRARPANNLADWHNLMGYSLRRQPGPDLDSAAAHYSQALRIDPTHRGANEYLGELHLMRGNLAAAETRLEVLGQLCPAGCEERADLQRAIERYRAAQAQ